MIWKACLRHCKVPERLAPGRYRIQSMSGDMSHENPFGKLLELKGSQHVSDVEKGQRKLEHNINFK